MDHDALAALFRRIILAGFPLLSGGCTCPPATRIVPLPSEAALVDAGGADAGEDAGVEELAARCRASAADCDAFCAEALQPYYVSRIDSCQRVTTDGGELAVRIVYTGCIGGRRPEGLLAAECSSPGGAVGSWLAGAAHLEAASVDAFEILAAELRAHGAPAQLVRAARGAAGDERRHARMMGDLAARRGARRPAARVVPRPLRSLEEIARENAVEGCVRETFAALLACRQARAAGDPEIRAAMAGIAADETRHAALSWAVDRWARGRLPVAARRRVREQRREAADAVTREASLPPAGALRAEAGLPGPSEAVAMAVALSDRIW